MCSKQKLLNENYIIVSWLFFQSTYELLTCVCWFLRLFVCLSQIFILFERALDKDLIAEVLSEILRNLSDQLSCKIPLGACMCVHTSVCVHLKIEVTLLGWAPLVVKELIPGVLPNNFKDLTPGVLYNDFKEL